MKRALIALVFILTAALAAADVTYTFKGASWSDANKDKVLNNGKAFLKEPAFFRIEFTEAGNPMMGTGTYMISNDGKTIFLVNPKEKTYSKLDMEQMLKLVQAVGGMVEMKVENPKASQTRGTQDMTIAGLPAKHYLMDTSYTMKVKVLFMKSSSQVSSHRDLWYTEAFPILVKDYFQARGVKSGFGELDKLVELETVKVPGILLKSKTTMESKDDKGKVTKNFDEFEITAWEKASLSADLFVVPAGYKETPMLGAAAEGGEGEEENPLKNLFQ